MPQIDDLSIKIKGSSDAVSTSVDKVIKKLGALNNSLSNLNTKGLQKFASGMQLLSNSMQGLSNIKLPDYNRVAKGISKFEQIDGKKLAEVSNALHPLTSAISSLNGVKADGNITNLVNALTRLGNSNVGNVQNVDFGKIGNSIVDLSNKLQVAQSVSSNTIALTNSVARLGATGDRIGYVAQALQPLGTAMVQFSNSMANAPQLSAETIQFTNALGVLASAGSKTATTAANLTKLGASLKNFMAEMSTVPIVRHDIIQMTDALARLTNQGGRVSLATNNMAKGFHNFANSSKHATKATHNLAYAFGKFYANFWLLIRAFKGIGKMINYASDLTEVQNVVDTTFTNMSYKVDEFAKDSINSFGMSELSVKQYASRFQAMGTAMNISTEKIAKANEYLNKVTQKTNADGMTQSYVGLSDSLSDVSLNLTKLTADMASFYNVEQSDVAKDLESIFTGSTRPLMLAA